MFRLLIDTCVWLDLAKDPHQEILLTTLESLVENNEIELILPITVLEEFNRNKARVIQDATKSISSTLKRAREIVHKFSKTENKHAALKEIQDIDHTIPTIGDAAIESVNRIESLFKKTKVLNLTDDLKLQAAQRAIDKRAPFHRPKNSMADAIIIEFYARETSRRTLKRTRYAFITHNKVDFSQSTGDERIPHPDIADMFSKIKSLYSLSLADILRRISPEAIDDATFFCDFEFEPKRGSEIINEINELTDKVWYNRNQYTQHKIKQGKIKIIPDAVSPKKYSPNQIKNSIWAGALKSAENMRKKYGEANLGPWTDFEWGMINGKLSALRWVLGDDWDNLDT